MPVGCTVIDEAATRLYRDTGLLALDEHGQMEPDSYGSGYVLCMAEVRKTKDGKVVCDRGHGIDQMLADAEKAGRPNAKTARERVNHA